MFKTPKIDFDKFAVQMLPPVKRKQKFIAFFKGVLSGVQRLNNIFKEYIYGSSASYWDSSTTYSIDDEVYYKYGVYKSLVSGNLNNDPKASPDKWELILDSFIGIEESTRFFSQKITLEWALNRYFKHELAINSYVGFKQPNDPVNPTNSDIYISPVSPAYPTFLIGETEAESDSIGETFSTNYITEQEDIVGSSTYLFSVNIPTSVFSSINANADLAEKTVRQFLDQYIPLGIFYQVNTY